MKMETNCVHAGRFVDTITRGVNTPIFTSSVYEYLDTDDRIYPRYFNTPNQQAVVKKLCALEGAEDGLVFSSGMAAITTVLMAFLKSGDHAVVQEEIYGGSHTFISDHLQRFGVDYTFVKTDVQAIVDAVTPQTRLIYIESPTNPLLNVIDIRKVAEIGKHLNAITVIDNTFASPINQNPFKLGIDIVIHSGTKYLGGHSDICCGAVVTEKRLADIIKKTAVCFGGCLNATTCYLLERSMKTLAIRVERQTENALKIATYLEKEPRVNRVFYPGLTSHPSHHIARSQMRAFGAMLSFELNPNHVSSKEFLNRLKLIQPALSLGGVESIICEPATTSHQHVHPEIRHRIGISDHLLRLSVGIEHIDDLIDDINNALG